MKKEIDLNKILIEETSEVLYSILENTKKDEEGKTIWKEWILDAMEEACRQTLILVIEEIKNSIADLEYESENKELQEVVAKIGENIKRNT